MPACSENPPARAAPLGWPKFVRITGANAPLAAP